MSATPVPGQSASDAVVICVENLPPRRDRRVWRQACSLRDAGIEVVVIGQAAPGQAPGHAVLDGIELYSYQAPCEASSAGAFFVEYVQSFWRITRTLHTVIRRHRVRAVQFCNPPDIFFPLAPWLRRRSIAFVFDHHDLVPELFATRYPDRTSRLVRSIEGILRWCERATLRSADHVVATNESYREIEMRRGRLAPEDVTVVRNGPEIATMSPRPPVSELRRGFAHLVIWFGNMGKQDGVDAALAAIADLVNGRGRDDTLFVFCGRGEMVEPMRAAAGRLGIGHVTEFTGWVTDDEAFAYLSTASIGLSADPPGPLNDVSTMNKTMEYMAFGLPVVAFDLLETRRSAGDAALYADSVEQFADHIETLLDDESRRATLGRIGRRRIESELSWERQRPAYVGLYRRLGVGLADGSVPDDTRTGYVSAGAAAS